MSSTVLSNPYTAILHAIWSIIKYVAQAAGNNLGKIRTLVRVLNHEYNTNNGAGNPLQRLLHPECRNGGVA